MFVLNKVLSRRGEHQHVFIDIAHSTSCAITSGSSSFSFGSSSCCAPRRATAEVHAADLRGVLGQPHPGLAAG